MASCQLHPVLGADILVGTQLDRWKAVGVMDILTELGLFAVAIIMTYSLRLPFSKKIIVLLAFGLRMP